MNMTIRLFDYVGDFAEDKDKARELRKDYIIPELDDNNKVILDFEEVNLSTQSFIHALISDVIRKFGVDILDRLLFKNCNESLQLLVNIVVEYMQYGITQNGLDIEET